MSEKAPAFLFYAGDWVSSPRVTALTLEEEGAFARLLAFAWLDPDCGIPTDDAKLRSLLKGSRNFLRIKTRLSEFFEPHPVCEQKLVNPRLFRVWQKWQETSQKRSKSGKAGSEKRWTSEGEVDSKCHPSAMANAKQSDSIARSSSSSSSSSLSSSSLPAPDSDAPARSPSSGDAEFDQAIVALWNETADRFSLPKTIRIGKKLTSQLRARRKEDPTLRDLEGWRDLFRTVEESEFLTGRIDGDPRPFKAFLIWVTGIENIEKIQNFSYATRQANPLRMTARERVMAATLKATNEPAERNEFIEYMRAQELGPAKGDGDDDTSK